MTTITKLKAALNAMERDNPDDYTDYWLAAEGLRSVIAEMEAGEPAGYFLDTSNGMLPHYEQVAADYVGDDDVIPLYTHPQFAPDWASYQDGKGAGIAEAMDAQPKAETVQEPVAKDVNSAHTLPSSDCILSNNDYHEAEIAIMGHRLFRAVERMTNPAGESAHEMVDWLCDDSGMFKLFEKYFSPAAAPQAMPVQEPTDWRTPILDAIDKRCKAAQPKAET
jgi:hypothetical protein